MVMCNETDQLCILNELFYEIVERPYWTQVVFTVCMSSIFVVGVSGNLLTCIVIYCDKSMHTATNYYLFNLAISDLIVAFGILLELNVFYNYSKEYGDVECRAQFFLVVSLWNNSILIMTALAIERYIAIWHPLLLDRKPVWRRVAKIIVLIWTAAILGALPEIWTVRLLNAKTYRLCFIIPTTFARVLNLVLGLVTFVIPLGIMLFVYTMVAFKVNVTQRSYTEVKIFNHRNNSTKINGLIIALTLSFLVCWLPFFLLRVIIVLGDWQRPAFLIKNWDSLLMLCSCNSWFSIVLNPLLFSLMSTKFRKALKTLWNTKVRGIPPTTRTRTFVI